MNRAWLFALFFTACGRRNLDVVSAPAPAPSAPAIDASGPTGPSNGIDDGEPATEQTPETAALQIVVTPSSTAIRVGQTQHFEATVRDQHGESVSDPLVVWHSSNPGAASFEEGSTITANDKGVSYISASVGDTLSKAVVLSVADSEGPLVEIEHPINLEDGHTASVLISFNGHASDMHGASLEGSSLVWTDDVDGPLGAGPSLSTTLTTGEHTITLVATDGESRVGSTQLQLVVAP